MTWEELRKRFLRELLHYERRLERGVRQFAREFLARLKAEGYRLTPPLENRLKNYVQEHRKSLEELIRASAGEALLFRRISREMRDEMAARLAREVFEYRYPDGLKLSERIWWWSERMAEGVRRTLADGLRFSRSVDRVVYDMQYAIEAAARRRFLQVTTEQLPKWVEDLWDAGRLVIRDPRARDIWRRVIERVERYVAEFDRSGTYHASRRLVRAIEKAVVSGREALIARAVNHWLYDRQLFFLRRIARTEAANAFHLAQIRATEDDPEVIGYHWRLSGSHPKPDICDEYARMDFGLGPGVWPKDRVPRVKPHPHCMCYLVPRVTRP